MRWLLFLFLLILMPAAIASHMDVDIGISSNDIVREDVSLYIDGSYDAALFTTRYRPISIVHDGSYEIRQNGSLYEIEFPGAGQINFTLVYDDFIDRSHGERIFRTSFYPEQAERMNVSITLPRHFVLSDKEPSAVPRPDSISTDGQQITLAWSLEGEADISVFYEGEQGNGAIIIYALLAMVLTAILLFIFFRRRSERRIDDMLSTEEAKVLEQVKKGALKQDQIAKSLGFSKSKMSKVARKLEQKGLIDKKPHFRTNILRKK